MNLPVVVVIGRPNVGKSTFFNRLTRTRDALVDDFPGVTRDRHYGVVNWCETQFNLVDTGGCSHEEPFSSQIHVQISQALHDADAAIVLLDGKNGISPFDIDTREMIQKFDGPCFYAVNKIDGYEHEKRIYEFYQLGVEELFPISAEHGYGINTLLDSLLQVLPVRQVLTTPKPIRLAIVGRPNVGKSSLLNRIVGAERMMVSSVAGTTRDAVDTLYKKYCLVDTAGIRRKGRTTRKLEKLSVIKAIQSMSRCDLALIVLDASQGVTDQDITIAGYAHDRGCGCILILNKWDLVSQNPQSLKKFKDQLKMEAKFLNFAPVISISALTGRRVLKIFPMIEQVYQQYCTRIGTGQVNKLINQAVMEHEPSLFKGRRLKFYYSTQISCAPPTFVSFVNFPKAVHFSYQRYLINQIRQGAKLDQTPLRLLFRQRTGHIDFRKKKPGR